MNKLNRNFPDISGSEAVDWLLRFVYCESRENGVLLLQRVMDSDKAFSRVETEPPFQDGAVYYTFDRIHSKKVSLTPTTPTTPTIPRHTKSRSFPRNFIASSDSDNDESPKTQESKKRSWSIRKYEYVEILLKFPAENPKIKVPKRKSERISEPQRMRDWRS